LSRKVLYDSEAGFRSSHLPKSSRGLAAMAMHLCSHVAPVATECLVPRLGPMAMIYHRNSDIKMFKMEYYEHELNLFLMELNPFWGWCSSINLGGVATKLGGVNLLLANIYWRVIFAHPLIDRWTPPYILPGRCPSYTVCSLLKRLFSSKAAVLF
jgi:hypothetical protein